LSGYLVGGKGLHSAVRGDFSLNKYAAARAARLYTVVLPALALTAIADALGNWLTEGTGFQSRPGYDNLGWWPLLANVAMLQNIAGPTFGSNTPFWTLALEFWFYACFAMVACAIVTGRLRWLWVTTALVIASSLGWGFVYYATFWAIGMFAATVPPSQRNWMAGAFCLFVITLGLSRLANGPLKPAAELSLAAATGLLLWACKARPLNPLVPLKQFNASMAGFSFSLYAVHYPSLLLVLTLLGGPAGQGGYSMELALTPGTAGLYFVVVLVTVTISWGFAQLTERHTGRIRAGLLRPIGMRGHC
jgi:peptidoglycan/LPS O-acetylase OafA/YrhL